MIHLFIRGKTVQNSVGESPIAISRLMPERRVEIGKREKGGSVSAEIVQLNEGVSWTWAEKAINTTCFVEKVFKQLLEHSNYFIKLSQDETVSSIVIITSRHFRKNKSVYLSESAVVFCGKINASIEIIFE